MEKLYIATVDYIALGYMSNSSGDLASENVMVYAADQDEAEDLIVKEFEARDQPYSVHYYIEDIKFFTRLNEPVRR